MISFDGRSPITLASRVNAMVPSQALSAMSTRGGRQKTMLLSYGVGSSVFRNLTPTMICIIAWMPFVGMVGRRHTRPWYFYTCPWQRPSSLSHFLRKPGFRTMQEIELTLPILMVGLPVQSDRSPYCMSSVAFVRHVLVVAR